MVISLIGWRAMDILRGPEMYISEQDFAYILKLTCMYNEQQRFRFKELMFELLELNGCEDLKVLYVTYKELVCFQPEAEVITRPIIDEVHRKVQKYASLHTTDGGQNLWRLH